MRIRPPSASSLLCLQILSKIASVDVAIYLLSKAKSAVSDLPEKSEVESEVANEFDNFYNRFVAHVILNRDNYRNNSITSVTSVTSVDGLHWYLSGPKAERHVRYRITASSNQIKEKLEQECPTYILVEVIPPKMSTVAPLQNMSMCSHDHVHVDVFR